MIVFAIILIAWVAALLATVFRDSLSGRHVVH